MNVDLYTHTIAVSTFVWGMGTTMAEARKQAESVTGHPENLKDWIFYRVHEDAFIDTYGRFNYPEDTPPIEIEREGFGEEYE